MFRHVAGTITRLSTQWLRSVA